MLARVLEQQPNLTLMIPFVRTAWELESCLDLVSASPVAGSLPVWVMAEVPSVVYRIPDYAAMGIEGVSIGSNDLTQLMLGVDRDSDICSDLFDESDEAVLDAIARIIGACRIGGYHVVALWPGPLQPAGVRRVPGTSGDHVGQRQPRRGAGGPTGHRPGRVAAPARGGRPGPPVPDAGVGLMARPGEPSRLPDGGRGGRGRRGAAPGALAGAAILVAR